MAESDSDSISINSTAISELEDQYQVEQILDEVIGENGNCLYLVKWEGYPVEETTWEPKESFLQNHSLQKWQERKKRIQHGIEEKFDTEELDKMKARLAEDKEQRRQRRQVKRERLGLHKSLRTRKWIKKHASMPGEEGKATSASNEVSRTPNLKRKRASSDVTGRNGEPERIPKDTRLNSKSTSSYRGNMTSIPKHFSTSQKPPLNQESSTATGSTASKANPISNSSLRNGRVRLTGAEIFGAHKSDTKQSLKKPTARRASDLGRKPTQYGTLSWRYKAQVRANREPAPDIQGLTFVNLKDGKVDHHQQQQKPSEPSKTPFQMIQDQRGRNDEAPLSPTKIPEKSESISVAEPADDLKDDDSQPAKEPEHLPDPQQPEDPFAHADSDALSNSPVSPPAQQNKGLNSGMEFDALTETTRPSMSYQSSPPNTQEWRGPSSVLSLISLPYLVGNYGSKKPDPSTKTKIADFSDIYCDLIHDKVTEVSNEKAIIRGLSPPVRWCILDHLKKSTYRLPIQVHRFYSFKDYMQEVLSLNIKYHGAGHILSGTRASYNISSVSILCSELREMDKAGLFFSEHLTLVIYPAGLKSWYQVDNRYKSIPDDGPLRVLVTQPWSDWRSKSQTIESPAVENLVGGQEGQTSLVDTDMTGYPFSQPDSYIRLQRGEVQSVEERIHEQAAQAPLMDTNMAVRSFTTRPLPAVEPTRDPRLRPRSSPSSKPQLPETGGRETNYEYKVDQQPLTGSVQSPKTPAQSNTETIKARKISVRNMSVEDNISVFKKQYGINWYDLLPYRNGVVDERAGVFVQYPDELKDERAMLVAVLQKIRAKVYVSNCKGDWTHFQHNVTAGVILIHESERNLSEMPGLGQRPLTRPDIKVYRINLGRPYCTQPGQVPITPTPRCTKLFPSGTLVLFTDSVILQHPKRAARFLAWFRKFIMTTSAPFTWQFFTRPRFPSWLTELFHEKIDVSVEVGEPYFRLWQEFDGLAQKEHFEADGDTPMPGGPFCSAYAIVGFTSDPCANDINHVVSATNHDKLIEWFAELSLSKIETHRKMIVLYDGPGEAKEKWGKWAHLCITTSEEFLKGYEIAEWASEEQKKADKEHKSPATPKAPNAD